MAAGDEGEQELEDRQAGLHPIGRVLRSTYHADNHDSLGRDLTGLMLQLARVEDPAPVPPAPASPAAPRPRGWFARWLGRA